MSTEKSLLMNVSKDEMDTIDEILQSKKAAALVDENTGKLPCTSSSFSSSPVQINVPINPSLETIGALCELKTAELNTEVAESDDGNCTDDICPDDLPQCLEELILFEHNYATNMSYMSNRKENKQIAVEPEKQTASCSEKKVAEFENNALICIEPEACNISPPVRRSKRQIEKLERELVEKETGAEDGEAQHEQAIKEKVKEKDFIEEKRENDLPLIENNLNSKIDNCEALNYCQNYKNFADFKKRHLKIVIEDCRYQQNQESKNISSVPLINTENVVHDSLNPDECKNESTVEKEELSSLENSESSLRKRYSSKNKVAKSEDVEKIDINLPTLRKRKLLKTESKDVDEPLLKSSESRIEKSGDNLKKNLPKERKIIQKPDECEKKQIGLSFVCKKRKCLSLSNNEENPEFINPPPLIKKKKSVSFSDELVVSFEIEPLQKKHISIDCKVSPQKNIPSPVTSPAITSKLLKKKAVRRESFRSVINEDEPPLFSQPDIMVKVKTDDVSLKKEDKDEHNLFSELEVKSCDVLKKNENEMSTPSPIESVINDENVFEQNVTDPPSQLEHPLSDALETELKSNSENKNSIPLDSLVEPETISKEETHHLIAMDENVHNDSRDNTISFSENDIKNEDELELPEYSLKQSCNDENIDESLNDLKSVNQIPAIQLSDEEKSKPGRKSSRLIKKKEFFGDTSDGKKTSGLQNKKGNAEKENADDNKKVPRRGRRANVAKKDEKNYPSSQSDLEVGTDSDSSTSEEEEDDPEKLWCICRKPHNSRFMIQCDKCEDWFHGSCVGVTKQYGRQLEKQKKEWICPNCRIKGESVPLEAAKQLEHSLEVDSGVKKGLQVLKKKDSKLNEHHVHSHVKKPSDSDINKHQSVALESEKVLVQDMKPTPLMSKDGLVVENKPIMKEKALNNAEIFNKSPKLKILKSPTAEHKFSTSQKQSPSVETKTSDHQLKSPNVQKNSVTLVQKSAQHKLSNTSSQKQSVFLHHSTPPTKKNMPIKSIQRNLSKPAVKPTGNKKKCLNPSKEKGVLVRKKQNCVQCQLEARANSCYCSDDCIEKHAAHCLKTMREIKEAPKGAEFDSQRLVVFDRLKGNVITSDNGPTAGEIVSWLKANPSFMIACSSDFTPSVKKDNASQKKECDSSSGAEKKDSNDETAKVTVRLNVRKTLKNILMDRCKNADSIQMAEDDIQRIAYKIEEELHSLFKDNSFKYRAKYRSLMFNIKDPRNQGLFRKILKGNIPPDRLVRMSSEELASMELARWREQENQHLLDMIKRVQLEHQKTGSGLLLKKTHKGEVEIEDDMTSIIEQDVPKTISKDIPEEPVEPEKEEVKDTTHLHRSHLFDLNCKICTGKILPPPVDESIPKKVRVAHSISVDLRSPNAPDSVEKSVSRIVDGKSPLSSTGDDSMDQEPTSTVSIGSPEISVKSSVKAIKSKPVTSAWKGFIFMQDIAKFVTSAYKVSGQTDQLHADLPDTIQVCGRIIPDQVWDYLGKIKQSGNKELIIIRFQAANEEEAVAYHSFYSYLNSKKRYGVVSNYSKKIKDFYLLPLASTSPVPMVLVPFDGPGLPSPRPHLLLGVIVRHKFKQAPIPITPKQTTLSKVEVEKDGSYTPPHEPRSYTPPLPALQSSDYPDKQDTDEVYSPVADLKGTFKSEESPLTPLENEKSVTDKKAFACLHTTPDKAQSCDVLSTEKDDDKPYDPEQDVLSLASGKPEKSSSQAGNEKSVPASDNLEKHKKILDALTRQVEETDRQVNALKQLISLPEDEVSVYSPSAASLDISSVAETGMSSFLDLPENLQEILNAVRLKSHDKDKGTHEKGDVDMRIKNLFGKRFVEQKQESLSPSTYKVSGVLKTSEKTLVESEETYSSQAATPPPNDDDSEKSSVVCPSDPRIKLRTSFQEQPFISNDDIPKVSLSNMSASELMAHAQKQLVGEKIVNSVSTVKQKSKSHATISTNLPSASWSPDTEPPPPGIEPAEFTSNQNFNSAQTALDISVTPVYDSTSLVQESSQHVMSVFPPQSFSSFPAHLPPGFSVHTPPPNIKHFPPPPMVTASFPPPSMPIQVLPPKGNESNLVEEQWPALQLLSHQSESGAWQSRSSNWEGNKEQQGNQQVDDSMYFPSERSNDYPSEHFYKRGSTNRDWERPQRFTRDHWNKSSQRGDRFENQRRGRRTNSFRRNQRN